ncbi:ester cyclase [Stutzerimonas balearica]|uniref:ester cyclase n=1 Tax=Stutzerimonas balearica TaxID=74829 RepID=UPI001BAF6F0C|nr:ester cyclase [Stutzerimonas balearica]WAN08936.1 ester cyclase [Stutzerimonas balearica]
MSADGRKKRVCTHIDLSWNKGRLALSEQLQSRYFSYKSSVGGQPLNATGFAELVRDVRNAVPDLEVVVDECLCEGHRVVTTCTVMGTLTRPLLGCPANDKILAVAAISLWTFNSAGEIEDVSTLLDLENARLQLGLHSALGDGLSTL